MRTSMAVLALCGLMLAAAFAKPREIEWNGRRLEVSEDGTLVLEGADLPANLVISDILKPQGIGAAPAGKARAVGAAAAAATGPEINTDHIEKIVIQNAPNLLTITFGNKNSNDPTHTELKEFIMGPDSGGLVTDIHFYGQTAENMLGFDFSQFPNLDTIYIDGYRALYSLKEMNLKGLKKLVTVYINGVNACAHLEDVYVEGAFDKERKDNGMFILNGAVSQAEKFRFHRGDVSPRLYRLVIGGNKVSPTGEKVYSLGSSKRLSTTPLRHIRTLYYNPLNDGWDLESIEAFLTYAYFKNDYAGNPLVYVNISCNKYKHLLVEDSLKGVKVFRSKGLKKLLTAVIHGENTLGKTTILDLTDSFVETRDSTILRMYDRKIKNSTVSQFEIKGGHVVTMDFTDCFDGLQDLFIRDSLRTKKLLFHENDAGFLSLVSLHICNLPAVEQFLVDGATTTTLNGLTTIMHNNFFTTASLDGINFPTVPTGALRNAVNVHYGTINDRNKEVGANIVSKLSHVNAKSTMSFKTCHTNAELSTTTM